MPGQALGTVVARLKTILRRSFRLAGFDIVRVLPKSHVMGTFPPRLEYSSIGQAANYFIHDGYRHRTETTYFDDTRSTDESQREVYRFAREVFDQKRLTKVCDVGCGSAYKLVRYFGGRDIVGLDVAETCAWLRRKYPHLTWLESDFKNSPSFRADLVVASDVIEHILEPDALLSYIAALSPKYIVLSTPDRNLLGGGSHNGPPRNPAHVREWSFAEFDAYVDSRFEVLEHFISNNAQATQCVLCVPRNDAAPHAEFTTPPSSMSGTT